jgi:hypothetical protein
MKTPAIVALIGWSLLSATPGKAQFTGGENFNANLRNYSIWSGGLTNGVGALRQTNGHAVYSLTAQPSGVSPNELEVWYWTTLAPSTQSWSVQIETTVPLLTITNGQQIGFGLLVFPETGQVDYRTNYLSLQLRVSIPSPGRHLLMRTVTNTVQRDISLGTAMTNTTLMVSWDATTQVLQGFYLSSGSWLALDSTPIVNPFAIGSTNKFRIGFFGQSQSLSVSESDGVFGDNFSATMVSAPGAPVNIWTAVEVTFQTQTNKLYQVQWASVVNTNAWFNLGGLIPGTGLTNSVFDSTRGQQQKYYRIIGYD